MKHFFQADGVPPISKIMNAALLLTKFLLAFQVVSSAEQCTRDSFEDIPLEVNFSCPPPHARTCSVDQDCPCPAVCRPICSKNICMQLTAVNGEGNWEPHEIVLPNGYSQTKKQVVDPDPPNLVKVQEPTSTVNAYQGQPLSPSIVPVKAVVSITARSGGDMPVRETNVGEKNLAGVHLNQPGPPSSDVFTPNNAEVHLAPRSELKNLGSDLAQMPTVPDASKSLGESERQINKELDQSNLGEAGHWNKNDELLKPLDNKPSSIETAQTHLEEFDKTKMRETERLDALARDNSVDKLLSKNKPQTELENLNRTHIETPPSLTKDLHGDALAEKSIENTGETRRIFDDVNKYKNDILTNASVQEKDIHVIAAKASAANLATPNFTIAEQNADHLLNPLGNKNSLSASERLGESEMSINKELEKSNLGEAGHWNKNTELLNPFDNKTSSIETAQTHLDEFDKTKLREKERLDALARDNSVDKLLPKNTAQTELEGLNRTLIETPPSLTKDLHGDARVETAIENTKENQRIIDDLNEYKNGILTNTSVQEKDIHVIAAKTSAVNLATPNFTIAEQNADHHHHLLNPLGNKTSLGAFERLGESEMQINKELEKSNLGEAGHWNKNDKPLNPLDNKTSSSKAAQSHLEEFYKTKPRDKERLDGLAYDNSVYKLNTNFLPKRTHQTQVDGLTKTLIETPTSLTKDFHGNRDVEVPLEKAKETQTVIGDLNAKKNDIGLLSIQGKHTIPQKIPIVDLATPNFTAIQENAEQVVDLEETPKLDLTHLLPVYKDLEIAELKPLATVLANGVHNISATNTSDPVPTFRSTFSKTSNAQDNQIKIVVDGNNFNKAKFPLLTGLAEKYPDLEEPELIGILRSIFHEEKELKGKKSKCDVGGKSGGTELLTLLEELDDLFSESPLSKPILNDIPQDTSEITFSDIDLGGDETAPGKKGEGSSEVALTDKNTPEKTTGMETSDLSEIFEDEQDSPELKERLKELKKKYPGLTSDIIEILEEIAEHVPNIHSMDLIPIFKRLSQKNPGLSLENLEDVYKEIANYIPSDETPDFVHIFEEFLEHFPNAETSDMVPILKKISRRYPGMKTSDLIPIFEKIVKQAENVSRSDSGQSVGKKMDKGIPKDILQKLLKLQPSEIRLFLEKLPVKLSDDQKTSFWEAYYKLSRNVKETQLKELYQKRPDLKPEMLEVLYEIARHVPGTQAKDLNPIFERITANFPGMKPDELVPVFNEIASKIHADETLDFTHIFEELIEHIPEIKLTELLPILNRLAERIPGMKPLQLLPLFKEVAKGKKANQLPISESNELKQPDSKNIKSDVFVDDEERPDHIHVSVTKQKTGPPSAADKQDQLVIDNRGPMEDSVYMRVLKKLLKKNLKNKSVLNNKRDQDKENYLLTGQRATGFKGKKAKDKNGDYHTHIHLNIRHGGSD